MNLNRDNAFEVAILLVMVDDVDGCLAVQLVDEMIAIGDDLVIVPLVELRGFRSVGLADDVLLALRVDFDLLAAFGEDAAARLRRRASRCSSGDGWTSI